jgi:hypothetical protein
LAASTPGLPTTAGATRCSRSFTWPSCRRCYLPGGRRAAGVSSLLSAARGQDGA